MPVAPIKLNAKGDRVEPLQTGIDAILGTRNFKWRKVPIDGVAGQATFGSAHMALWLIGASDQQLAKVRKGKTLTAHSFNLLTGAVERSAAMKKRDQERRPQAAKLRKGHRESNEVTGSCWGTWRGFTVAAWMVGEAKGPDGKVVNWLQKSVEHGWGGGLYSGGRTPEHSEELCLAMCGAPSCSGTCAGRSSNHSGCDGSYPGWGAIDVQEYEAFGRIQKEIGSPLQNRLPNDRPHYSVTGN
jgi:hypothetical protein